MNTHLIDIDAALGRAITLLQQGDLAKTEAIHQRREWLFNRFYLHHGSI